MFKDRQDAAVQLAQKLEKYKNTDAVILAVPRGGIPIGYTAAKQLELPLEIVLSKKIGHPNNPEFAIGSVSLQGGVINDNVRNVSMDYIHKESKRILTALQEKFKLYMGNQKPADLKNKTVIIIDDGIATGNTILGTIEGIKKSHPKKIVVAVPVASPYALSRISKTVDEFICVLIPHDFSGVAQFYYDFSQVSDEEVIKLLHDANKVKEEA